MERTLYFWMLLIVYNFPLYTLAIRDDYGHGVPVAFIVTGNEKEATLEIALQQLRRVCPAAPRYVYFLVLFFFKFN